MSQCARVKSRGWSSPGKIVVYCKITKEWFFFQPEMACSNLFSSVKNRGQKTLLSEWKTICLMLFSGTWDGFH